MKGDINERGYREMFAKYYIVCYGLSGSLGEQMDAEAGKKLTATAVDKCIHLIHYTAGVL